MNFCIELLLAMFVIKIEASGNDVIIEKTDKQFLREGLTLHLSELSESTTKVSLLGAGTATGYFYAEYHSKSNCSGTLNYVEGYPTGVCMPRMNMTSGIQMGSIIQTCTNVGKSCCIYKHAHTWHTNTCNILSNEVYTSIA